MVDAIIKELKDRAFELKGNSIETIYFGGGTPSVLSPHAIESILGTIESHFEVQTSMEITFEANPDDCDIANLKTWKSLGINRLSIGVQSFDQHDLEWMNRSHTSNQAKTSIRNAAECGFDRINMDLIYGVPEMPEEIWHNNVSQAMELPIDHISAYSLTVEEGTALHSFIRQNKYSPINDEKAVREFEYFQQQIDRNGWLHYEISNYCKPGAMAIHNTNYWKQKPYLGVGPSAHSYNGKSRRWNLANNPKYMKSVLANEVFWEEEKLSWSDQVNEFIMLGLRTMWGVDLNKLQRLHGHEIEEYDIDRFVQQGLLSNTNSHLVLTREGKAFADQIASELFV